MKFSFDFAYRSIEGGEVNIGETKTEKGTRTILLPKGTLKILTERKKNSVSEWIFPSLLAPEKPTAPSSAYHRLKVILKGAKLPDIRFHDLRHTFATHALTSGVDAKTLSGILGHVSSATTLDIYSHITDEMQKSAANKIEKHFAKKKSRLSTVSTTTEKYPKKPQTRRVRRISSRIRAKSARQAQAEFIR